MPLNQSIQVPERILSVGPPGAGKSTNWLNVLKWSVRTGADSHFYVGDSDFAIARMLTNYPECAPHVTLYNLFDWPEYVAFQKDVLKNARPLQDWVVVDFIGSAWQAVQAYYVEQVFSQDIGNYFLQARRALDKDAKSLGALEGWVDWSVINPLYRQWVQPLLFKGNYHIYCTAKAEQLSSDKKPTETAMTRQLFIRHGSKPQGQKDLAFQFHTVLMNGYTPRGANRTITTVKDRERTEVSGLVVENFTVQYLRDIAGWKLS